MEAVERENAPARSRTRTRTAERLDVGSERVVTQVRADG